MKLSHKLATSLAAIACIGMVTPSFAGHGHHHRHVHHYRTDVYYHHDYRHYRSDMAFALGIGALAGGLAVAAASDHPRPVYVYNDDQCREVVRERSCHYNGWGEYHCHRVRYMRYFC